MKLLHHPETDSLYIELKSDHASRNVDLQTLETADLPLRTAKAA